VESLVIWLTTRCQLRCRACYLAAGPDGVDLELALAEAAFARLRPSPGAVLHLAGGEPGLVPELADHVSGLARAAGWGRIALQTNGLAIDDRFLTLARRHRWAIGISLDGPPALNDRVRGDSAGVLAGLTRLERAGLPFGVTATVTAETVSGLADLALLLGGFAQARSLGLDLLRPLGRGAGVALPSPAALAEGYAALGDALAWVNRRRARPLRLREAGQVGCPPGPAGYCPAERGRAAVLVPGGGLWPCSSLVGHPCCALGTVAAPDLAALARGLPAGCAGCAVPGCRGRCPARALISPAAAALDCLLRRAAARALSPESDRVPA